MGVWLVVWFVCLFFVATLKNESNAGDHKCKRKAQAKQRLESARNKEWEKTK